MGNVIFFISTGRCGTQWVEAMLASLYEDYAVVRHEPLKAQYNPKKFFRAYDKIEELRNVPEIKKHIDYIHNVTTNKSYIETGWPFFAALPLFYDIFGERLKLVHLIRHPVEVGLSLVTHHCYFPDRVDQYSRFAMLDPFDAGITQKECAKRWKRMNPYEKSLFHWTEINLYALELQKRFNEIPVLRVKFEDIFQEKSEKLKELVAFLGLPFREEVFKFQGRHIDQWHTKTNWVINWKDIFKHPNTVELAGELDYNFDIEKIEKMRHRYLIYLSWWDKLEAGVAGFLNKKFSRIYLWLRNIKHKMKGKEK